MLTSKQRSNLKALANTAEPIAQVGKLGVTENLVESVDKALTARELVKISVLKTTDDEPIYYADVLAEKTGAEVVAVIGRKITMYRRSNKPHIEHIEF